MLPLTHVGLYLVGVARETFAVFMEPMWNEPMNIPEGNAYFLPLNHHQTLLLAINNSLKRLFLFLSLSLFLSFFLLVFFYHRYNSRASDTRLGCCVPAQGSTHTGLTMERNSRLWQVHRSDTQVLLLDLFFKKNPQSITAVSK